jgi:radical SAM superfamily enzyme YgiQ (UPF0313 family)
MNILLIYPQYPDTFWSFKHALKFISKKAVNPPLGLITVASMLPEFWDKKLKDLNIELLKEKDISWADMIFISAMNIQLNSVKEIIDRCKKQNKIIVCGGPLFTESPNKFSDVDHLVLNEAEITLPDFLEDLKNGKAKRIYKTQNFANIASTPLPDYSLLNMNKYNSMNLQLTRGCPFNCEFCEITTLFGRKVRIKTTSQIMLELEAIYNMGWRKNVFFVDDNFIGNKNFLKVDFLPTLIRWMQVNKYPFKFSTEVSINLSDDNELLKQIKEAGFSSVFVGIETTEMNSLKECGKKQNTNRNLVHSVRKIQSYGIEVNGGFILGFDNDTPQVFQNQIDFIKSSGIISAMVGLLNAPKNTLLYKRLKKEGRLLDDSSGNNTDFSLNFIPKMDKQKLLDGYTKVISGIYGGKEYYSRVMDLLKRFKPNNKKKVQISLDLIFAFIRSQIILGLFDSYRKYYWNLFFWALFNRPHLMPLAITYSVYGFHFRKIFKNAL